MHYDTVDNYAMKCRLYPSPSQKGMIDDALTAVRVFHNCIIYDMRVNGINVKERPARAKDGEAAEGVVHFPDISAALRKEYKDQLIEQHPIIKACPQAALTTNVGLKADLIKEFGKNPLEFQKPRYYNELHPRLSYTYQEALSKIQVGENRNVFHINLAIIGSVKVRGWNQKLRFGDSETDFLAWAVNHPKEMITVTVSKDMAGDYYIVFKIKQCLKPFPQLPQSEVGIDVGVKDIAITSDGQKYENKKFKKQEKRHQKLLNRKLSRRWGPSNEAYREARKKNRQEWRNYEAHPEQYTEAPPMLNPSNGYLAAKAKHAKLNRKIAEQRSLWNHEISRAIVANHGLIAVETLSISGMVRNKHLSYALTDAAFGSLLANIAYKARWHGRELICIDQWTPSSKRCSACGYVYNSNDQYHLKPWNLSIRNWVCPQCGAAHDRDINAAKNILYYAKLA